MWSGFSGFYKLDSLLAGGSVWTARKKHFSTRPTSSLDANIRANPSPTSRHVISTTGRVSQVMAQQLRELPRAPGDTEDGRNPFRTTWKPWKIIVCWCLQGNHHSRVAWVVQDIVHPQYDPVSSWLVIKAEALPFLHSPQKGLDSFGFSGLRIRSRQFGLAWVAGRSSKTTLRGT